MQNRAKFYYDNRDVYATLAELKIKFCNLGRVKKSRKIFV